MDKVHQIRSFLNDFQSLDVRKAKALLQTILASAHVYKDGRIELAFRQGQRFVLAAGSSRRP